MNIKGGNITKAYLMLIAVSIISKVLGFAREVIIAQKFGVSEDLDMFLVALTLPNIIYGVLLYAIPNYVVPKYSSSIQDKKLKVFSEEFFWNFVIVIFFISAIYFIASPLLMKFILKEANPEELHLAIVMTRLLSLYAFLTSVFCAFKGVYHLKRHFVVPAISPLIIHLVLIISILVFGDKYGIIILALAMSLGAVLQLVIIILDSKKKNWLNLFKFRGVKKTKLEKTLIIIIGIELLGKAFTFIDRSFTSFLPIGYISG